MLVRWLGAGLLFRHLHILPCINFLVVPNKVSPFPRLRTIHMYHLTVSISEWSGHRWTQSSASGPSSSQGYNQGVSGAAVSSEAQVGKNLLPRPFRFLADFISLCLSDWAPQVHTGYQLETAHSFLPHGPLHRQATSPAGQHTFSKPAGSLSLQLAKMGSYITQQSQGNDIPSPFAYSVDLKQVTGSSHTQEEGIIQGCHPSGVILGCVCHTPSIMSSCPF